MGEPWGFGSHGLERGAPRHLCAMSLPAWRSIAPRLWQTSHGLSGTGISSSKSFALIWCSHFFCRDWLRQNSRLGDSLFLALLVLARRRGIAGSLLLPFLRFASRNEVAERS